MEQENSSSDLHNARYKEEKLTLLTSNHSDEPDAFSGETLTDRVGARLRSRLYEMCKTVSIVGKDFRHKISQRREETHLENVESRGEHSDVRGKGAGVAAGAAADIPRVGSPTS